MINLTIEYRNGNKVSQLVNDFCVKIEDGYMWFQVYRNPSPLFVEPVVVRLEYVRSIEAERT